MAKKKRKQGGGDRAPDHPIASRPGHSEVGRFEERTRVVVYLPHNQTDEELALNAVLDQLSSARSAKDEFRVDGYTISNRRPCAFEGAYVDTDGRTVADAIVEITVDFPVPANRLEMSRVTRWLKLMVQNEYSNMGCPQDDIWLISFRVYRETARP